MNTLYQIETKRGRIYQRRAWTGGDVPPMGYTNPEYNELVEAFYNDQIQDASFGGRLTESEALAYWECAGTSAAERKELFMNRARLDAWRTLNH